MREDGWARCLTRAPSLALTAGAKGAREKYLAYASCTSMRNTVDLGDTARKPLIHDRRSTAIGKFTSLFNKLLGCLLLCLVCSGAVAAVSILGQMTKLAYEQMRVLIASDVRNI